MKFHRSGRTVLGELNGGSSPRDPRKSVLGGPLKPQQGFVIYQDENDPGLAGVVRNVEKKSRTEFWAEKVAKLPTIVASSSSAATANNSYKDYRSASELLPKSEDEDEDDENDMDLVDRSSKDGAGAAVSSSSPPLVGSSSSLRVPPLLPYDATITDATEYTLEILHYLKETETKLLPKWNYMTKQPDITFVMRSILVDWLVEVGEEYKLCTETLYLTVNYIDRFLSYMSVQRAKLQLVGTACMFISAKYEEIYPPDVNEFTYITDDTYNKKQVLRMEHLVLKVLGFDLSVPTAYFFVNQFAKLSGSSDQVLYLAQYLSELTLLDAERYLCYNPSIIGASAVTLARHTCHVPAWPEEMVRLTGYQLEQFQSCLVGLHQTLTNAPKCAQQAMREKYRQDKYLRVSEMAPVPISS